MAAPKSDDTNRAQRRAEMVAMRKRGLTYGQIAKKFGVNENTARIVVLNACNQNDPKPFKERIKHTMTKMTQQRINDLEIENAELRRIAEPTLRDQFAMAALQAMMMRGDFDTVTEMTTTAFYFADKMLEVRDADNV
jgi:orotate phosphoribosyltransferase-like protein